MVDDILVAFDGSEEAAAAASKALELADELGAELHYIEVVDVTDFPKPVDWEEVIERIELESSEELEEIVEDAREKGLYGGKRVTRGIPHEEIIERAEEVDADMIFMGKRGLSNVENLLGSTTERVIEKSDTPVVSVSAED